MTIIRWFGLSIGIVFLWMVFQLFRRGRLRRFDFALAFLFSFSLICVSLEPDSVNILRDMLVFREGQFSRLISICIVSNILLWLLLFYTRFRWTAYVDQFDRLLQQLGISEFERQYPEIDHLPPVVVVLPAYNEAENISAVLTDMPSEVCGMQLAPLLIDDGSEDNTLQIARDFGAYSVRSPIRRGGGAALRIGFAIACQRGAKYIVTMDADGQHQPHEIEKLLQPLVDGDFDFIIGSRILGEREKDSAVRYAGIHVFNAIIRFLTPVRVTDCSSGFRALSTEALSRLTLRQDQFHTSEFIIEAAKRGIRIGEAPVLIKRRLTGESKKGKNWSYGLAFARTVLKTWWR